jgi:hypothetical protein
MSDIKTPDIQTPADTRLNANDELWNNVRGIVLPLVQLIAAKRDQFCAASNSQSLAEIYREDCLRQAAKLSEAESLFCNGLQLFKQAIYVQYPMTPEPNELSIEQERWLPEIYSALVN